MATLFFSLCPFPTLSLLSSSKTTQNSIPIKSFAVKCLRSPETYPPPAVQKFWGWLSDKGIVLEKSPIKPGIVPEGLGLIAQRDIDRNEVVLEVPKRFWINPDTVAASDIGPVCDGLKPWVSVALFLIREKKMGDDSPWKPYIDILPEYTHSTIFWSEVELSELQGSQLLNTTLGVKELVANEFAELERLILRHKNLFPFSVTINDFFWAFAVLRSRAFTRLRGQSLVLIPFADLINHNPSITAEDYTGEVKGAGLFSRDLLFCFRNPIPVKAGDQVLIQYDLKKNNAELALDYGFVESRPERDAYTLTLDIPESDPFFEDKLDIAETNGLGKVVYFDITLDQPLPATMLPYLRLLALERTDAYLLESIFRDPLWGHLELPVSRTNEELICRLIHEACESALSGYSTTIEEDEKLMEKGNLDLRVELALKIRSGEKRVLQKIDKIFKERETELGAIEYYSERRLKEMGLGGARGEILPWIGEV